MKKDFKNIAIIGVGLIGGSIGLSLKHRKFSGQIIGAGRRESSLKKAKEKNAVDEITLNIKDALKNVDLVIVAVPVEIVSTMAKQALKYMKAGSILIDVASTKLQIVSDIQKFVPEGVYYVGTHPIAGSEKRGAENSDPNLFQGANCIITPIKETNKQALKKIKKFWKFLGSRVFEMNPETHDRAVACTSHMPHLLAFILVNECCEYLSAAGGSFKDATRVAKSSPEMWAHVFIENRRNIVKSVKSLILQLEKMSDLIDLQDKKKIEKILESAKKIREKI